MSNIAIETALILGLILLNGVFALAEIAIVSARKSRLQQRANEGDLKALQALALAKNPADFLSATQIGITLIGVLAGALGGATIAQELSSALQQFFKTTAPGLSLDTGMISQLADGISVALVVLAITYLSVVLGELAPKRLALHNPETLAASVALPLYRIFSLARPVVRLLSASTDLILRLVGAETHGELPITEDEIKVLMEQGTQAGIFEAVEQDMVAGVFRLADRRVGSILTPRTEIVWLDLEDTLPANLEKISQSIHNYLPVARGDLDNLVGVVYAKDLLGASLAGVPISLEGLAAGGLAHEPLLLPENTPVLTVLERFKENRQQMALVLDEFGGIEGLVTLNDILEAIIGDFPPPGRPGQVTADRIVQREDGSWLIDGLLPIDEVKEALQVVSGFTRIVHLPQESTAGYQTLGGFIMTCLGRIPIPGDHFTWGDFRFEVMDMDGLRVDKVLVTKSLS